MRSSPQAGEKSKLKSIRAKQNFYLPFRISCHPFGIFAVKYTSASLPGNGGGLPGGGDFQNSFHRGVQGRIPQSKRETDEVMPRGAKGSSGNGGDSGFFQHDSAHLFRG